MYKENKPVSTFSPSSRDHWIWHRAQPKDVEDILDLVAQNYEQEIDNILRPNRSRMAYHLHQAVLDQIFGLNTQNVTIARDKTSEQLLAWAWIVRDKRTVYADEEMGIAEFAHVDLSLSARDRITLTAQTIEQWILWCEINNIPVLSSTSIRADQSTFMRLHEQFGFVVRGSYAFRRIS